MAEQAQPCSISSAIEQGTIVLSRLSDSAKLDTQLLLAHALAKNVTYLLTWPEQSLSAAQFIQFQQLLTRRVNGEPIAYIIGEKEFWSLPLKVSSATLIPRPDTEILIEQALSLFAPNKPIQCLDLGTGTGAIALALASECSSWQIEAVDFNLDAVNLANQNAKNLNVTQINIYQSDWFSAVDKNKQFELIVSNPPYIDEQDQHLTQGDVKFEPHSALVADNNGLADIEHIATHARDYLRNKGYLLVEHGYEQAQAVQALLLALGYQNIQTIKDLSGNDRITQACWIKTSSH